MDRAYQPTNGGRSQSSAGRKKNANSPYRLGGCRSWTTQQCPGTLNVCVFFLLSLRPRSPPRPHHTSPGTVMHASQPSWNILLLVQAVNRNWNIVCIDTAGDPKFQTDLRAAVCLPLFVYNGKKYWWLVSLRWRGKVFGKRSPRRDHDV